ncbi:hypothetical protein AB0F17_19940 [Nonomuraea sp. NPDC026600]|uniref:hypothetical protein n=1 Tax=Nonomuraea sp. NPDC026600 TaxID=3155363 RepID=UPI0033F1D3D0
MNNPMRTLLAGAAAAAVVLTAGTAANAATTDVPKFKAPKAFGTTFQTDPKHDFTKHISSRHDGILRGLITHLSGSTAEYTPVKWKKGTVTEGQFVTPPEGDVMAYSSPIAKNVVFLSAFGCKVAEGELTIGKKDALGVKSCSRSILIKRHKRAAHPSLITVYKGEIVKVQEIYTP